MSMRDFFRYLLVLSVLAMGYYGASQHRLNNELPEMVEELRSDLPAHSATSTEESPLISSTPRSTPLAALIDTDRSSMTEGPGGSADHREEPAGNRSAPGSGTTESS
jgi:hypothetical protein